MDTILLVGIGNLTYALIFVVGAVVNNMPLDLVPLRYRITRLTINSSLKNLSPHITHYALLQFTVQLLRRIYVAAPEIIPSTPPISPISTHLPPWRKERRHLNRARQAQLNHPQEKWVSLDKQR